MRVRVAGAVVGYSAVCARNGFRGNFFADTRECAGTCAYCGSGQRIAAYLPPFRHHDAVLTGFRRAVFDGGAVLLVGV